jgi:hypothetical protein
MRSLCLLLISVLLVSVLIAGLAGAADPRPLASLIPPDASTYSQLDVAKLLGQAPSNAAVGQALGQMKSPALFLELLRELLKGEAEEEQVTMALGLLKDLSVAAGPQVGYASWMPDAQTMLSGMMAGEAAGSGDLSKVLGMMPKMLLVADVKDPAALDAMLEKIIALVGFQAKIATGGGVTTMSFAEGAVQLVHGSDWLAFGFPAETVDLAVARATGMTSDSLWGLPAYQGVLKRLPAEAASTEYVSAAAIRQLMAAVNMMAPSLGYSYAGDEPLGLAMGVKVDEVSGKQLATFYYTMDLAVLPYLIDAPLALQATIIKPVLLQQKEQARKQRISNQCAEQLSSLAEAMDAYLTDHEGRYPEANGWVEAIRPYLEDPAALKCPEDPAEGAVSYGMNAALSGLLLEEVADVEWTVLFYETAHPGKNPFGGMDDVADPGRHVDGNNFAFVDGSTGAFSPAEEEQPNWDPAVQPAEEEEAGQGMEEEE